MNKKIEALIKKISEEMKLEPAEKKQFEDLVASWEEITDTMAEIEPDDDYSEDIPRLKKLRGQEDKYDKLHSKATLRLRTALNKYCKLRKL